MTDTLYLVDTYSLVFQVFHAIRQPLTNPQGAPTNAVFGFTGDIKHLIEEQKATHLICAFEGEGPGERAGIDEMYKSNRSEMPPDLKLQIPMILRLLEAFQIPVVRYDGWEADDVIATLARRAVEDGLDVRIVTADKDARQLIRPKVKIYSIRKKQVQDEDFLMKEWGIRPDQVIDFQSLVGDSVDNVAGIPLVGPKKAAALLNEFGTLEDVLANAEKAPGKKLRENLVEFADRALQSRQLVTLKDDLPLDFDWEAARVSQPDPSRLLPFFNEMGFRRYSQEMEERLRAEEMARPRERTWHVVDTPEKFNSFLKVLKQQKRFCFDLETTQLDAMRAEIVGWAICWRPNEAWYTAVQGPLFCDTVPGTDVLRGLRPLLEDPQIEKFNQNIKYDMLVLRQQAIVVQGIGLDPMIGDYLLDAGARSHGLDDLAKRYLQRSMIPISELIGKGKNQKCMADVAVETVAEYASEDADVAFQLAEKIESRLKEERLWDLYWDLERPLISVLTQMEFHGVKLDLEELHRQSMEANEQLQLLIEEIQSDVGHEFNIDSPKQLATVLFDELNLPVTKRTKTGPSTDAEVLERLALMHPLPAKIIQHRQLAKLKGTYLDALPAMVNPRTGKIHTSFSQVVAATGRLSSSDPNLQNIPVRTEAGRQVRRAFIPSEEGWSLLCADYSQIELRMLAHFSQDPALRQAFREGVDIHAAVAAQVFDLPLEQVDADRRRIAKAVNFGVIYGQTGFGLSRTLGIPKEDAERFIRGYFETYSRVGEFIEETLDAVHESGYATTILGRRREIQGIRPRRFGSLNFPERTAFNAVIQGSAADLIKRAMITLAARLDREKSPARMLLQIHDELIFECPQSECERLTDVVREEMISAIELTVPLVVDIKTGRNWLDAE